MNEIKINQEVPEIEAKRQPEHDDLLTTGSLACRSVGADPAEWRRQTLLAKENPAFDVEKLGGDLAIEAVRKVEEDFAKYLIEQIETRMNLEAQVGRGHAIVMSLVSWDYSPPAGLKVYGLIQPEWLRGAARMVYDYCNNGVDGKGPDLKPTLEYWDDGVGRAGGFNIVAHFPPSPDAPRDKDLADLVISQIPARAMLEATQGRGHALLMSIPVSDIDTTNKNFKKDLVTPDMLKGSAKTVFDYCQGGLDGKGADLKPTIEYWDDGKGEHNGFNIVIHW
jgi:hypothetical protein